MHVNSIAAGNVLQQLFSLLTGIVLTGFLYAQSSGQFLENSQGVAVPFTVTCYSTKQGLPQSQVLDIQTLASGNMLLTTANGVVEYDGYEFSEFISDNRYRDFFPKDIQLINGGSALILTEYHNQCYLVYPKFTRIGNYSAVTATDSTVFLISPEGKLCRYSISQNKTTTLFTTEIRETHNLFFYKGAVYASSARGLFRLDLKKKSTKQLFSGAEVNGISMNPYDEKLYFFTRNALFRLNGDKAERIFETTLDPEKNALTDVAFIAAEEYYLSSTAGLFFNCREYDDYFEEPVLPSDYLVSLCYDERNDCLFVGTGEKGVLKLQHKDCYSFTPVRSFTQTSLGSVVYVPGTGTLVAGSSGRIFRIGVDSMETYFVKNTQFASLSYYDGTLFAGTWNDGLYPVRDKKIIGHLLKPALPDNTVLATFRDKKGVFWIGTGNGVANARDILTPKPFLSEKITGAIICFYEMRNGNLCIGGENGVYILDSNRQLVTALSEKQKLTGRAVRAFYEDSEGKLWIGTYNGGLYCLENNKLTSINRMPNCMLHRDVFTLAEDRFGYLNITSNHGLWKVREKDLQAFYRGKLDRLIPFYFGQETGILNTEFNGGFQNNFVRTRFDHFFFPTIEGVIMHAPANMSFSKLKPMITHIWVNDTLFTGKHALFDRKTHTIEFHFSNARFNEKFNTFYQYQLLGDNLETNWSRLQKGRTISFKMLPPGKYTLVVRAVDAFNDPQPATIRYSFEIQPYFYETAWFSGMLFVLTALILAVGMRWQFIRMRNKERQINTINNTILELKLKAIQAKMNPHFIFNALNNIQYLIVLRDLEKAEKTLTEFSLLLRRFLQQSDATFVTLEDELEMLRLYLSIEQFRYNNQLQWEFSLTQQSLKLYIPSMLLQPLVENALKHGLTHTDRDNILRIVVTTENGLLRIVVEDNGVGREVSRIVNSNRKEHISHGNALVREKIKIVRQKYGITIGFEVVDIRTSSNTGTRIVLTFPKIIDPPAEN